MKALNSMTSFISLFVLCVIVIIHILYEKEPDEEVIARNDFLFGWSALMILFTILTLSKKPLALNEADFIIN